MQTMVKFLKIIQTSLIVLFVLVYVFVMILNWDVYSAPQTLNYGFGTVNASFLLMTHSFGLIVMILLWLIVYSKDLRYKITYLKEQQEALKKDQVETQDDTPDEWDPQSKLYNRVSKIQKEIEELKASLKDSQTSKSDF